MERDVVRDPVCGMEFRREEAATTVEWDGLTYYFCCHACRVSFEGDPKRFLPRQGEDR